MLIVPVDVKWKHQLFLETEFTLTDPSFDIPLLTLTIFEGRQDCQAHQLPTCSQTKSQPTAAVSALEKLIIRQQPIGTLPKRLLRL